MKKIISMFMMFIIMCVSVIAQNGNSAMVATTNQNGSCNNTGECNNSQVMAQQQDQEMLAVAAQGNQPEAAQTQKAKFWSWKTDEDRPRGPVAEAAVQAWERVRNRFRILFGLEEPETNIEG